MCGYGLVLPKDVRGRYRAKVLRIRSRWGDTNVVVITSEFLLKNIVLAEILSKI